MRKTTFFLLTSAAVLFLLISVETNARAATFTVNTTSDGSDINPGNGICSTTASGTNCTLRAAVEESNAFAGDDIIVFDSALANQTVGVSGELVVQSNITINGPGARVLTVSGNSAGRIFAVDAGFTLNITDLTLTDGTDGSTNGGGAILNQGTVSLQRLNIFSCSTGGAGGGIANLGTLTIRDSTFFNNRADAALGAGGGLYVNSTGTTNIYNSTFSLNTSTQNGGAILKINSGVLNLINVTVANNTVLNGNGGGIGVDGGNTNVGNSLIAQNTDTVGGNAPDVFGNVFTSLGNNLIGDGSGSPNFVNGVNADQVGSSGSPINPQISSLIFSANSPTRTHILLFGSPAIDAGRDALAQSASLTLDQRGLPRFIDGFAGLGNDAPGTVDIGAVETQTTTAASVPIGGRVTNSLGRGIYGARVFLTAPSGEIRFATTNPFGYYRFDDVQVGLTYIFDISAKRYTFTPQAVTVNEQLDDLNFTALP